jgi:hypothetical protein
MKRTSRKHYVQDGIRDDNRRGMQLSGDVFDAKRRSELQLHEVGVLAGVKETA